MAHGCEDVVASHLRLTPRAPKPPDTAGCAHPKAAPRMRGHTEGSPRLWPAPRPRVTRPCGSPSPGTSGRLGPRSGGCWGSAGVSQLGGAWWW